VAGLNCMRIEPVAGSCEHYNGFSSTVKGERFFCIAEQLLASQERLFHGIIILTH
jgi:hypothetical protein